MGLFCKTHVKDRTDQELRDCAIFKPIWSESRENARAEIKRRCEDPSKPCIGTMECSICGRFFGERHD